MPRETHNYPRIYSGIYNNKASESLAMELFIRHVDNSLDWSGNNHADVSGGEYNQMMVSFDGSTIQEFSDTILHWKNAIDDYFNKCDKYDLTMLSTALTLFCNDGENHIEIVTRIDGIFKF